jgi:hypothetical protein
MNNPWVQIPESGDFVLPEDRDLVYAFNAAVENDSKRYQLTQKRRTDILNKRLDLTLPPNPFAGLHEAPLVVLLANPGVHDDDIIQKVPENAKLLLDSLKSPGGSPMIWLTDKGQHLSPSQWWQKRTKELQDIVGGAEALSRKMLVVELHGYHSVEWSPPIRNFPSQNYSFELVEAAIERNVPIIIGKCSNHWLASVPRLGNHEKLLTLSSTRQASLSSNNIVDRNASKEKGFALVREALKK